MNKLKRICFCGNRTGEHLGNVVFQTYEKHLLPPTHHLIACDVCGFVFADFEANQSVFDKYYEFYSKYEDAGLSVADSSPEKKIIQGNIAHFIEKNLVIHKNSSIMDIGCALGSQLKCLRQRGYKNIYGLDPSQKCVDHCNSMGITAFKGSVAQNDIAMVFDTILMDNVLEHVYDINNFFNSVLGLLKPDGYLVVRVPDARLYTPAFYTKAFSAFTIEHINHFDNESLINLGKLHGLSIISSGFDPHDPSGTSIVYKKVVNQDYLTAKKSCVTYLKHSEKILKDKQSEVKNKLSNSKIAIWGIGSYYSRLAHNKFFDDFEVVALVDKDLHKQNQTIADKRIISPKELRKINEPFSIVVCAEKCGESIIEDIKKLHFNNEILGI